MKWYYSGHADYEYWWKNIWVVFTGILNVLAWIAQHIAINVDANRHKIVDTWKYYKQKTVASTSVWIFLGPLYAPKIGQIYHNNDLHKLKYTCHIMKMYEKIWLKFAKFAIKLFYSLRVSKKKTVKTQNFVKNRPSFKILANLADETKMIINIKRLSRNRERVIR